MARAWMFQANPDRFDIDGALSSLDTMRWRVPQYTSEIRPGDAVVLWRSGREAGVVGLGRITAAPREEMIAMVEERKFDLGQELSESTTVVDLRVIPCPFVAKDEVAELPAMASHRILTAPMGTVFPLADEEWAALQSRLPEAPQVDLTDDLVWPAAFSWEQRTKSVTPLPGGIDAYTDVLAQILCHVAETEPARDELAGWVSQHFAVGARRSEIVVGFLTRIGLLRNEAARLHLTPEASHWLAGRDNGFLLAVIHCRVRYVGELLADLDTPRTIQELLQHANSNYGMNWTSSGQIVRRRHLLGGLGAIELDEEGRLRRTSFGESALTQLRIAHSLDAEAETAPADPPPAASGGSPAIDDAEVGPAPSEPSEAEALVARLMDSAHDSTDPDAFEEATRDAFAFLGFDARWLGRSGRTDVLLTAPLGVDEQYRVVIDTKTTARDAVGDAQIDWVTIDEHQQRYGADYVAVVAPAFRGERLTDRARRDRSVALLTVTQLSDVVRQHAIAPLDLDAYRRLFDPDVGPDGILEQADAFRRQLVLAAEIVGQIERLAGDEGVVTASDLYWNLDAFADQFEGQRAAREEITAVGKALADPPLSLVRAHDHGYAPLGSPITAAQRLRLLADLIENGIPETSA